MHDTGYCWRPECVYPYESLRLLLGKFMFLNKIGMPQLNQIQLASTTSKKSSQFRTNADLLAGIKFFENIDRGVLQKTLGLSEEQLRFSTITPFETNIAYEKSLLRHCPSCLSIGYHSPFQQLEMFTRCPIHGEQLRTT